MRTILLATAALVLSACNQADNGADQLDTADLDTQAQTPTPAPTAPDDQQDLAQRTIEEMAQPVACSAPERTLFFCEAGRAQIAVCGTTDMEGRPNAQYRYGVDQAELVLSNGRFASVPYSGGGEAQIEFASGTTRYIVYSRTVRTNFAAGEANNPEFTDGVMVVRDGETVADRQCTARTRSIDVVAGEDYGGVRDRLFYPED